MEKWLALAAGGITGTVARYLLSGWIFRVSGPKFPLGTLAVNLSGCFLIGLFAALGGEKIHLTHEAKLFLITGFCGAYTTFSTFILETDALSKDSGIAFALLNVLLHVLLGFLLFRGGVLVGESFS